MDIKQYKKDLEDKVVSTIKSMVNEHVEVQANYDINKDLISVLLLDEQKKDDLREHLIVYSCNYLIANKQLSVAGFVRRYGYDNFGVSQVVNDPVTVDEPFINGIKTGIEFALNPTEMAAETVTE